MAISQFKWSWAGRFRKSYNVIRTKFSMLLSNAQGEEQAQFVAWWRQNVTPRMLAGKPVTEPLQGLSQDEINEWKMTVSRWAAHATVAYSRGSQPPALRFGIGIPFSFK
jgi:hypothetical protein